MSATAALPVLPKPSQSRNLALATLAFGLTFWAWNLIGPLAVRYSTQLHLTTSQKSMLIATPVLVGALGRIPVGALTDRYGGRVMFTVLSLVSILPVLGVAWATSLGSYGLLLVFAFVLGIAGTSFAAGIPFVNAWYDAPRRGFATGVFGAGMGGTALSAYFTPRFVNWFGETTTFVIMAVALAVLAAVCWTMMQDSPRWSPNTDRVTPKLVAALKLPVTWQLSFLYAVVFGGFVAFSTYLPTYINTIYGFSPVDAGGRTAVFSVAAVVARPVGGVLSDKIGPKPVVLVALAGAAVMAVVAATKPEPDLGSGTTFVLMALFLGLGTGGVFAWVARLTPVARVGTVAGIVGAAGGLGGYFPPLIMGETYNAADNSYTVGLLALCLLATVAFLFTLLVLPKGRDKATPKKPAVVRP
jgi:NNP family nitrate/nitrite transporter-like MFS transporter